MIYDVERCGTLQIGRQQENLSRTIRIDISKMLQRHPRAKISLWVQRSGEDTPYSPEVSVDDGVLYWDVTSQDTSLPGYGYAEIRATRNGVLEKSAVFKTYVRPSLPGGENMSGGGTSAEDKRYIWDGGDIGGNDGKDQYIWDGGDI